MAPCGFKTEIKYFDENTGKYIPYVCPEPEENILASGLCIFHDQNPKIKEAYKQIIQIKLNKKIEDSKPLICIGYHIPDISFEQMYFDKSVDFSAAIFMGLTNFSGAHFTKEVHFTVAQFNDEADFYGAHFTKEANFTGAQFTERADFNEAQFTERADFSKVKTARSNFSGVQFTEKADFSEAQFIERGIFSSAKFIKEADFTRAQFKDEVDFSEAQFKTKANFNKAQFSKLARISYTQFTDEVDFSEAQFIDQVSFYDTQFKNKAKFFGAKFVKEAKFSYAQFTNEANFSQARFEYIADFFEAKFIKIADFSITQFKRVYFRDAKFAEANFMGAVFTQDAYFYRAEFTDVATFTRAHFIGLTNYDKAKFMGITEFFHSEFNQNATFVFTIFNSRTDFNYVLFRDPEYIIFYTNNMSQVSFMNTDISRVKFGENVRWGLVDRRHHIDRNEFKIIDEREIETYLKNHEKIQVELGSILAVYRNLRENYEYRLRYDEAGEFFIRELEMKRNYEVISSHSWKNIFRLQWRIDEIRQTEASYIIELTQNNWIGRNFSLTGLYYHLSRYGQSFSRPTLFGIGIVIFSTFLWSIQPNAAGEFVVYDTNISQVVNSSNLEVAFGRSLTNFLPSLSFGTPLNVGLLDVAFKIAGGAVTFGLIIIALRRKFERKFRH